MILLECQQIRLNVNKYIYNFFLFVKFYKTLKDKTFIHGFNLQSFAQKNFCRIANEMFINKYLGLVKLRGVEII